MYHWHELELEPTDDAVAVKRAYAQKLKRTRPDDDPDGYQRLREAYERALEEARWRRENPHAFADDEDEDEDDEPDSAHQPASGQIVADSPPASPWQSSAWQPVVVRVAINSAEEAATTQPDPAAAPAGDSAEPPPAAATSRYRRVQDDTQDEFSGPEDDEDDDTWYLPPTHDVDLLLDSALQLWQERGDEALLHSWPELEYELRQLPLHLAAWTAQRCADWLLEQEELPDAFVIAMIEYFQWGRDFRADAQLGIERSLAIQERLQQATGHLPNNEQTRQQLADVFRLDYLRRHQRRVQSWLFALLTPPAGFEPLVENEPRSFGGFGLDRRAVRGLRIQTLLAILGKCTLLAFIVGLLAMPDADQLSAGGWWVLWSCLIFGGFIANEVATLGLSRARNWLAARVPRVWGNPFVRHGLGLFLVTVAGLFLLSGFGEDRSQLQQLLGDAAPLGVAAVFVPLLLLIWPAQDRLQYVALPLLLLLSLSTQLYNEGALDPTFMLFLGYVWLTLLFLCHERYSDLAAIAWDNPFIAILSGLWSSKPNSVFGWIVVLLAIRIVLILLLIVLVLLSPLILVGMALIHGAHTALIVIGCSALLMLLNVLPAELSISVPLLAGIVASTGAWISARIYRRLRLDQVPAQPPG